MHEALYELWLTTLSGLGLRNQLKLLEIFGSSQAVYEQPKTTLMESFRALDIIDKSTCDNLLQRDLLTAEKTAQACRDRGIGILRTKDPCYPQRLSAIYDPPILLYYKGNLLPADGEGVAVVGARKATPYGKWISEELGKKLAEYGVTVISGMAYGIDSASHRGALAAGGRTIAVLGCGPDICYPDSNRGLMEEIQKNGAVISEFPPGMPPLATNFPRRNRLISGMARCLIIAEAGLASGSLITAEYALEQGKDVFAVPGNINSIYSVGTNKLIRDGATPLIRIADIALELGLENRDQQQESTLIKLGHDEKIIYQAIRNLGTGSTDSLCRATGKSVPEVHALVTILEIKGIVETAQGKIFIAK